MFISRCLVCQKEIGEHQHPIGLLQSSTRPEWLWENIAMAFVVWLSRTQYGYDAIRNRLYSIELSDLPFLFNGIRGSLFPLFSRV